MADFNESEVRAKLVRHAGELGGVRAMARAIGVSPSYVSDVLNGRRAPGPDFLKAIGVRKEIIIRYMAEDTPEAR